MKADHQHRVRLKQLIESLRIRDDDGSLISLTLEDASREDDIAGTDGYLLYELKNSRSYRIPFGMKKRGANAGKDFNLTVCSITRPIRVCDISEEEKLEFFKSGNKLYFYWVGDQHILVQLPAQSVIDARFEGEFKREYSPDTFGRKTKTYSTYTGVRKSSELSNTAQVYAYVPFEIASVIMECSDRAGEWHNQMGEREMIAST
jgi:hypothetical protein